MQDTATTFLKYVAADILPSVELAKALTKEDKELVDAWDGYAQTAMALTKAEVMELIEKAAGDAPGGGKPPFPGAVFDTTAMRWKKGAQAKGGEKGLGRGIDTSGGRNGGDRTHGRPGQGSAAMQRTPKAKTQTKTGNKVHGEHSPSMERHVHAGDVAHLHHPKTKEHMTQEGGRSPQARFLRSLTRNIDDHHDVSVQHVSRSTGRAGMSSQEGSTTVKGQIKADDGSGEHHIHAYQNGSYEPQLRELAINPNASLSPAQGKKLTNLVTSMKRQGNQEQGADATRHLKTQIADAVRRHGVN